MIFLIRPNVLRNRYGEVIATAPANPYVLHALSDGEWRLIQAGPLSELLDISRGWV